MKRCIYRKAILLKKVLPYLFDLTISYYKQDIEWAKNGMSQKWNKPKLEWADFGMNRIWKWGGSRMSKKWNEPKMERATYGMSPKLNEPKVEWAKNGINHKRNEPKIEWTINGIRNTEMNRFEISKKWNELNFENFPDSIVFCCYNFLDLPREKFFQVWFTCFPSSWEQENSVEKRLCKFEAEGQEFVSFSRHCSGSRELGKQATNTGKKLWVWYKSRKLENYRMFFFKFFMLCLRERGVGHIL